jgi:hypothetical protein
MGANLFLGVQLLLGGIALIFISLARKEVAHRIADRAGY